LAASTIFSGKPAIPIGFPPQVAVTTWRLDVASWWFAADGGPPEAVPWSIELLAPPGFAPKATADAEAVVRDNPFEEHPPSFCGAGPLFR